MSRSLVYPKSKLYTLWDIKGLKSMLVINEFCKVKSLNKQTAWMGLTRESRKEIKHRVSLCGCMRRISRYEVMQPESLDITQNNHIHRTLTGFFPSNRSCLADVKCCLLLKYHQASVKTVFFHLSKQWKLTVNKHASFRLVNTGSICPGVN